MIEKINKKLTEEREGKEFGPQPSKSCENNSFFKQVE